MRFMSDYLKIRESAENGHGHILTKNYIILIL